MFRCLAFVLLLLQRGIGYFLGRHWREACRCSLSSTWWSDNQNLILWTNFWHHQVLGRTKFHYFSSRGSWLNPEFGQEWTPLHIPWSRSPFSWMLGWWSQLWWRDIYSWVLWHWRWSIGFHQSLPKRCSCRNLHCVSFRGCRRQLDTALVLHWWRWCPLLLACGTLTASNTHTLECQYWQRWFWWNHKRAHWTTWTPHC